VSFYRARLVPLAELRHNRSLAVAVRNWACVYSRLQSRDREGAVNEHS